MGEQHQKVGVTANTNKAHVYIDNKQPDYKDETIIRRIFSNGVMFVLLEMSIIIYW